MHVRRFALRGITSFCLIMLAALVACGTSTASDEGDLTNTGVALDGTSSVTIGTLATEDFLPIWAAEADGILSDERIHADIQVFQSAQELSAALTAGEVDFAMTDIVVAANLTKGGTPLTLEWVTLGATADQGRFGILTNPDSGYSSLTDLAGQPIAVASGTMLEYVMDEMLSDAQVPADQILTEEVKKVPVRYQMVTGNQVAAAMLPGSLLYLGEQQGMVVIADDTTGPNYSQSVMVARLDLAQSAAGQAIFERLRMAWNEQVTKINADPESFRALLVEKTSLPAEIADSYPVPTYPTVGKPTSDMVEPVLEWMFEKGYLEERMGYDPVTGGFFG
ncbi:MAG: ABC transporter substrate-binding protein [Coriobacteriales bacterium]|jgi:NitT/TauT family transport system substrate-binding protein|nr:ABC transporter substrate-binding protein [Coriobacteriales bacterium]